SAVVHKRGRGCAGEYPNWRSGRESLVRTVLIGTVIAIGLFGLLLTGCSSSKVVKNPDSASESTRSMPIQGPIMYLALGDSTGVGVGARNGGYVVRLFNR